MSSPSYADSPRNATNYLGQSYRFTPTYIRKRNPTSSDIRPKENQGYYPIGSIWVNSSATPEIWILAKINSTNSVTSAEWVLIANSLITGPVLSLSDNTNLVVPPSSDVSNPPGNIQLVAGAGITIVGTPASNLLTITNTGTASNFAPDTGTNPVSGATITLTNTAILATGTLANAIRSNGTGASTIAYQVQYAGSNAAVSGASKWGVAQFDANQFSVVSGFVQLAGGGTPPTLGIHPDAHTAPGTDPIVPDGSGNIKIEGGATFATGTQANPIRTNSLAANTMDLQIQLAGSNAAISTPNDFGVAQFDSNSFGVASGFVTLNNAGTTGAVTKLLGDDGGANTVVPSSGTITLDGVTVLNATNAKPVFFKKNAASVEELDVQLATTSTSGTKNITKSGLCHFDSTDFTVDAATGFVQLTGGASPAIQQVTTSDTNVVTPTGSPENINIFGSGSITTTGASPTATIALTGLTNHNVLVGAGTATITKVPPSATSGIPLISNGAAADPSFGTAVVAGGGTGDTSFTAYAVICGGTTSTGPLQNVSGVGTANQVLTSNGAGALPTWQTVTASGAVTQVTLDAATTPINPSAGNITLTGGQVPTGTTSNVIRTRGNSSSSCTIEIQRTTTAGASNANLNGVCHFDSSKFNVDTNGFVTFTGSTSNVPWTDEGGNFNASSNNGYFCTALLTATLPPTPAQGDVVKIVADTASAVTVKGNTGQKIRVNNALSASAGTAASNAQGNALELYYRSSSATWYALSVVGTWTVT